jgi:hypothetical protein
VGWLPGRPTRSWPTDEPEHWPASADADLSLSPRNLHQPFSNTQGDPSRLGRHAANRVGPELDRLVAGQSRRVDHSGRGEVLGECLERDASRQPWSASEHLDES